MKIKLKKTYWTCTDYIIWRHRNHKLFLIFLILNTITTALAIYYSDLMLIIVGCIGILITILPLITYTQPYEELNP